MCNKSLICGVLFASGAITCYLPSCGFYGPYSMDRNNYIEIHPTQAQVAKISYHHPSKCFPSTSILAFSYNVFIFWKMGLQASFKWSSSSLQFTMQKKFWSFDDSVKSSVITQKDNTTKFEILLTFDPSREMFIFILSVSGFTWFLMYRISSLSRLTYAPGTFPGILSKWYKLLISSWHWRNQICSW